MVLEILTKFNFLDFFVLILFFRICYMAAKMGLSIEIFKFLGAIVSVYVGLHYYTNLSMFLQSGILPKEMPLGFLDFIIFVSLVMLVYLCFVGLRSLLSRFIQLNAIPRINQFLGLVLGIGRGFLVAGLLSFTLVISSVSYFSSSVERSYLASKALVILPQTYGWLWSNIFSKFSTQEEFNSTVTQVMEKSNAHEVN